MSHASYGSLSQQAMYTKPFSETSAFVVFNQVCKTIQEIHSKGILHLDLKPQNILVEFCSQN